MVQPIGQTILTYFHFVYNLLYGKRHCGLTYSTVVGHKQSRGGVLREGGGEWGSAVVPGASPGFFRLFVVKEPATSPSVQFTARARGTAYS